MTADKELLRPGLISLVASFLMITMAAIALFSTSQIIILGLTEQYFLLFVLVSAVLVFVSAFFMLKAKNWSRWLYMTGVIIATAFSAKIQGVNAIFLMCQSVYIVLFVILLMPSSNAYFSNQHSSCKVGLSLSGFTTLVVTALFSIVNVSCLLLYMMIFILDNNPGFHI